MSSYYTKCTQKIFGLNIIKVGISNGVVDDNGRYMHHVSFQEMCSIEQLVWRQLTKTYGYSHKPDKKRHFIIKTEELNTFVNLVDSLYNKYCK
jgi:hypothetical protein